MAQFAPQETFVPLRIGQQLSGLTCHPPRLPAEQRQRKLESAALTPMPRSALGNIRQQADAPSPERRAKALDALKVERGPLSQVSTVCVV